MADLRMTVLLHQGHFDAAMRDPWQGIRSLSHKPRGIFLARDLKTRQGSFKMRFKGDKV